MCKVNLIGKQISHKIQYISATIVCIWNLTAFSLNCYANKFGGKGQLTIDNINLYKWTNLHYNWCKMLIMVSPF